jgi:hypothetical protein
MMATVGALLMALAAFLCCAGDHRASLFFGVRVLDAQPMEIV